MKPMKLTFSHFGPFMQEHVVDFEKLEEAGVFLISGETGAGKTVILDAMMFALYCESTGGVRGNFEDMRNSKATKDDVTRVEFIFESAGKIYKFERSLVKKPTKLDDSHNCYVYDAASDGWSQLLQNPKKTFVTAKAVEIIGLTPEQFRQVMILPQGQFEKLLTSDSNDKEKILQSIFHMENWEKIVKCLNELMKKKEEAAKAIEGELSALLMTKTCTSIEAFREVLALEEAAFTEAADSAKKASEAEAAALAVYSKDKELEAAFVTLDDAAKKVELLRLKTEEMKALEVTLSRVDEAIKIEDVYEAYVDASKEVKTAEGKKTQAENAVQTASKASEDATRALASHKEQDSLNERAKIDLDRAKRAQDIYEHFDIEEKLVRDAERAKKVADAKVLELEGKLTLAQTGEAKAKEELSKATTTCEELQVAYIAGIRFDLAETLEEGRPCPICGSLSHPNPAVRSGEDRKKVEKKDVEDAQNRVESLRKTLEAKTQILEVCKKDKDAAVDVAKEADKNLALAKQSLESFKQCLIPGIASEQERLTRVKELEKKITTYNTELVRLEEQEKIAGGNLISAKKSLQEAMKGVEDATTDLKAKSDSWKAALMGSIFSSEEEFLSADMEHSLYVKKRESLTGWKTNLESAEQELKALTKQMEGKARPNVAASDAAYRSAKLLATECATRMGQQEGQLNGTKATLGKIEKIKQKLDEQAPAIKDLRAFVDLVIAKGGGIGLERYVLSVMLDAVTNAANTYLRDLYQSRYQIFRTNEATKGRSAGLEFQVYDRVNGDRRSVKTLSGGEKFLVSLSLAIGLSLVVQNRGNRVRMDAMFIDEGFGTLSSDLVDEVIDIFEKIRSSNVMVGVISHVSKLESSIHNRIVVEKKDNGESTCRVEIAN